MKHDELYRLIDLLVAGDIGEADHAQLSQLLKTDADARAAFRARIDLEASLRTLASEIANTQGGAVQEKGIPSASKKATATWIYPIVAVAATALILVGLQASRFFLSPDEHAENQRPESRQDARATPVSLLGFLELQDGCKWRILPVQHSGRFGAGMLALDTGVAALRFDSGTSVTLQGPCEIEVTSVDSALLHAGNVCVNVGELSNGFTLRTPESQIVDEGTEFGVSLSDAATEIHVFEGSVIYSAAIGEGSDIDPPFEDRIDTGEAKSFSRIDPKRARHIPLGSRQFVRGLDAAAREIGGEALLAYDGFENLAGRVRRGRSGFGWTGGWQAGGPGRGKLAEIIDCPDDTAFGFPRAGRRMMLLEQATDIRRDLSQPLELQSGKALYVGVLVSRHGHESEARGQALQLSLEPDIPGRGRRLHQVVTFGVATDGFPFIRSANRVAKTATRIQYDTPSFLAMKLQIGKDATHPFLRVYRPGETIDLAEPFTWTVIGEPGSTSHTPTSMRITSGADAAWQIDELKIGTSWQSIHPKAASDD